MVRSDAFFSILLFPFFIFSLFLGGATFFEQCGFMSDVSNAADLKQNPKTGSLL
jgi:hypothetical protein